MKKILVLSLAIAIVSFGCLKAEQKPVKDKWVNIFNGKDLEGWTPKITGFKFGDNHNDTFKVEDGILKVSYDKYDKFDNKFGHLFYKNKFSHYRFKAEYRFIGEQTTGGPGWAFRNSGIMIHCQDPKTMSLSQNFPVCIEVQTLGGSGTGKRSTGNLCTPGTNVVINDVLEKAHCISSKSDTFHGDQWVTIEVEVHGNKTIKHIVNGKTVLEYDKPQLDERDGDAKKLLDAGADLMLSEGYISLQSESHPVEYRNMQIMLLEE